MTTLAILRTKDKMAESVDLAKEMGFEVLYASPLEPAELDPSVLADLIRDLETGVPGRAMLTTPLSVKFLFDLLERQGKASDVFSIMNKRGVYAIGDATADAAKAKWLKFDKLPEKFTSEKLAAAMNGRIKAGETIWVVGSDKGMDVIRMGLEAAGAAVKEVHVYAWKKTNPDRSLLDIFYFTVKGGIDIYAFTSPASAEAFIEEGEKKYGVRQFGEALNSSIIAALNESTKRTLENMGIDVDVMAPRPEFSDLLKAVRVYIEKRE